MSHRDSKPFKTIFDPSEIEEVLRWAQVAILNHNQNFELFIPGEGAVSKQMSLDCKFISYLDRSLLLVPYQPQYNICIPYFFISI